MNLGPDAPPQYPAAYPDVIAVTALDRRLNIYPSANRGEYLSVAAPGVDIWTPAAGNATMRAKLAEVFSTCETRATTSPGG